MTDFEKMEKYYVGLSFYKKNIKYKYLIQNINDYGDVTLINIDDFTPPYQYQTSIKNAMNEIQYGSWVFDKTDLRKRKLKQLRNNE